MAAFVKYIASITLKAWRFGKASVHFISEIHLTMTRVKMQSRGRWSPFSRHDYERLWFITTFTTSFIDSCLFFCTTQWNVIAHRIEYIHSSFLVLIIQQFWAVFSFTYCWVKLIELCSNLNSTMRGRNNSELLCVLSIDAPILLYKFVIKFRKNVRVVMVVIIKSASI